MVVVGSFGRKGFDEIVVAQSQVVYLVEGYLVVVGVRVVGLCLGCPHFLHLNFRPQIDRFHHFHCSHRWVVVVAADYSSAPWPVVLFGSFFSALQFAQSQDRIIKSGMLFSWTCKDKKVNSTNIPQQVNLLKLKLTKGIIIFKSISVA